MARLSASERAILPDRAFAYIDSAGRRRLPIHDEAHVRNALGRFERVQFEDDAARERARRRLLNAAKKYGIVPVGFIAGQLRSERSARTPDFSMLPTGTVTFLLTDIEGSTLLLRQLGDGYAAVLRDVRGIIRNAVRRHAGHKVDAYGDEYLSVFERAAPAVETATDIHRALSERSWPEDLDVRVRAGIHSGRPTLTDTGYLGLSVHTVARICSVAHGGQIVVSSTTKAAVERSMPSGIRFRSLGRHRLQGLASAEALFQIQAKGLSHSLPAVANSGNLRSESTDVAGMNRLRRSVRPRIWGRTAVLTVIAAACMSNGAAGPHPTTTAPRPTATSPTPSTPASCADVVFRRLTVPQRVGQLFAMGLASDRLGPDELDAIRSHHVGSVWFTETTTDGVIAVQAVAAAVQAQATDAATGGIGFYVAANQEGGEIQALRGAGFSTIPSAVTQGTFEPSALQRDASGWGRQLSEAGVNLDFAPVMDVVPPGTDAQNLPIGLLHREFGHDPATVATHGTAFIRGMSAAGIATTAKHFPGLGRVQGNTDNVSGVVDTVTTATDPSLASFQAAIDAGVPFVMVALATYTQIDADHLAVFSPTVMRLLRDGMGFDGVIVSDDLGAATAVASVPPAQRAIDFLLAGGDMIVSKTVDATAAMAGPVVARSSTDPAFAARVDDAVRRVLAAKDASGLLPCSGD